MATSFTWKLSSAHSCGLFFLSGEFGGQLSLPADMAFFRLPFLRRRQMSPFFKGFMRVRARDSPLLVCLRLLWVSTTLEICYWSLTHGFILISLKIIFFSHGIILISLTIIFFSLVANLLDDFSKSNFWDF